MTHRLGLLTVLLAAIGCSKGKSNATTDGGGGNSDAPCSSCDSDGDGVPDSNDQCPNTPMGQPVNMVGCSDSQLMPVLNPTFPPYDLTWTPTGDLGRAGGLTWTYTGIQRGDLFHIYWILCDDPMDPCGLSLDGPIDPTTEAWQYDSTTSNLALGKLVFTNTTHIDLADGSTPQLNGRLTVNIAGANQAPLFFQDVGSLHVHARDGFYGAEIPGTGYVITALGEVEDPTTSTWTPYMDYFDAQRNVDPGDAGGNAWVSFGGSFYDK